MVRILEGAALEVRGKGVRRVLGAVVVRIAEPGVLGVGARVPAEVVIERAVLLHEDDEVVDRHVRRARERGRGLHASRVADESVDRPRAGDAGHPRESRRLGDELATTHGIVGHGVTTVSQLKTPSSTRSTITLSSPAPQSISSASPLRALITSLPGEPCSTPSTMLS